MTDPVVSLDTERVFVEPGGQTQLTVTITNPSQIVEGYVITVCGEGPSRWAEAVPPEVSIYPQQQATAIIVFSPPAGNEAPSGEHAFGVKVQATSDPDISVVVEGDIEIGKMYGLQAKLTPVTSAGRWQGRHVIQLSNWGNSAARLRLVPSDPDVALGFYIRPDVVDLPLGGTSTVRMAVRTRRPFLRGTPVRLTFKVTAEPADVPTGPAPVPGLGSSDPARQPVVDGAFNQKPILSRLVVTALAVLLLGTIGVAAYAATRDGTPTNTSLTDLGTPPKVEEVSVEPVDATTVEVSWKPVDQVDGYEIRPVEGEETDASGDPTTASGSQRKKTVRDLAPGTRHCFRVLAQRGNKLGPVSDVACAPTPEAPTSPTPAEKSGTASPPPVSPSSGGPPPGGQPPGSPPSSSQSPGGSPPGGPATGSPPVSPTDPLGGGKWVAATGFSSYPERPVDRVAKLKPTFPTARVIYDTEFPNMRVNGIPRALPFLAAVGPYDSPEQAAAACEQIKVITEDDGCFPGQPEPP